jgi:hypothetical protein
LIFTVPNDSGEKVTLGISALLTIVLFLQGVSDRLPPTEEISQISIFYLSATFFVTLEVILAILVLRVNNKGQDGKPASDYLILVCALVARLTLTRLHDPTGRLQERVQHWMSKIFTRKISNNRNTSDEVWANSKAQKTSSLVQVNYEEEFKMLAKVLDRFFLALSVIWTLAIIVVFFTATKNLTNTKSGALNEALKSLKNT